MRVPLPRSSLRLVSSLLTKPNRFHLFTTTTTATPERPSDSTRPGPPQIRVGLTESAGRGVFATRPIGAGELIHTAKPAVCHPSPSALHTVCYFCLRKLPNPNGSEPRRVSFCSEDCKRRCKVRFDPLITINNSR